MKIISPSELHPSGHYVPAMISRGMLYISGQLPIDPVTAKIIDGDVAAQTKRALENIDIILKEAGAARNNVVQCRLYIPDMKNWDTVNKVYSEFFGGHKPARIVVPTRELHFGALIEIEATAEVEE